MQAENKELLVMVGYEVGNILTPDPRTSSSAAVGLS